MRRGLALLEVLVALSILSMVIAGYLELFHGGHVLLARGRMWSRALAYATDGMEQAKLGEPTATSLSDGYRRRVTSAPWANGIDVITVTVTLPDGAQFHLRRLRAQ
jgi:prepilin-type N-terminal cleavage/methylation domain-containing protein